MGNLLRRLAARNGGFLGICALLLAGFQYLVCAFVATFNVSGAVEDLLKSLPPMFQTVLGPQITAFLSPRGIVAFGWDHPVAQALGTAVAIVLAARAVAGGIEEGVLELVLSQPVSRAGYLVAQVLFGLGALAGLCLAGLAGTGLGALVFGVDLGGAGGLLRLAGAFFLLQAAWFGITLALSAFGREGGRAAGIAFLLAVASYLGQAIGTLLPAAAFVLPYCLHHYYGPRDILLSGALAGRSVAMLLGAAGIGLAAAFARFLHRDIP
jgi:ABC-type transport system involved in multi-copper enzyme maturation permease subunit